MRHIAFILLTLPDGRIVFQRRSKHARRTPDMLGFFGGHVEPGETYDEAMARELGEETSLVLDELQWGFLQEYAFTPPGQTPATFHLYWAEIPDAEFDVDPREAQGVEVCTLQEALARPDIAPSARYTLENFLKEK
jgi:8-oxo-dGTP diphosphatase